MPNYPELVSILIIGLLQPVTEILFGTRTAAYYNGIAALLVFAYAAYRIVRLGIPIFPAWGIRFDNFLPCLASYFPFAAVAGIAIIGYGWYVGNTPLPVGFWYVLLLYPIWGLAQQFVLQNLLAKNLEELVPSLMARSLIAASLFACAHIPSLELVILTFIAGFVFTYLYHFYSNLLALGLTHGLLGALVFHLVLGQDQWGILARYFS